MRVMLICFLLCAVFNGHTKPMKERESTLRPKLRESSVGKERSERVEERRDVPQSTATRSHACNGVGVKGTTEELRKQVRSHSWLSSPFPIVHSCPSALLLSFPLRLSLAERKHDGAAISGLRSCFRASSKGPSLADQETRKAQR